MLSLFIGSNPYTANADGIISFYNIDHRFKGIQKCYTQHAVKCLSFGLNNDNHFAIGHSNGKMAIYDPNSMRNPIFSYKAHEGDITSINAIGIDDNHSESSQIITSGIDGFVKLWDPRVKVPVMSFAGQGQENIPCYSASIAEPFADGNKCVIAGYESGDLIIHEIRANRPRLNISIEHEVTDFALNTKLPGPKKLCITSLGRDLVIVDLEKSNMLGQVVSKDFSLVPKEELPPPFTLKDTFTMFMLEISSTLTNWCVSYLPNSNNDFIVGCGNSTYMLVKYEDINNENDDINNNNTLGTCQFLSVSKLDGQDPIAKIDWYSGGNGLGDALASCTHNKIRITKIND